MVGMVGRRGDPLSSGRAAPEDCGAMTTCPRVGQRATRPTCRASGRHRGPALELGRTAGRVAAEGATGRSTGGDPTRVTHAVTTPPSCPGTAPTRVVYLPDIADIALGAPKDTQAREPGLGALSRPTERTVPKHAPQRA